MAKALYVTVAFLILVNLITFIFNIAAAAMNKIDRIWFGLNAFSNTIWDPLALAALSLLALLALIFVASRKKIGLYAFGAALAGMAVVAILTGKLPYIWYLILEIGILLAAVRYQWKSFT